MVKFWYYSQNTWIAGDDNVCMSKERQMAIGMIIFCLASIDLWYVNICMTGSRLLLILSHANKQRLQTESIHFKSFDTWTRGSCFRLNLKILIRCMEPLWISQQKQNIAKNFNNWLATKNRFYNPWTELVNFTTPIKYVTWFRPEFTLNH